MEVETPAESCTEVWTCWTWEYMLKHTVNPFVIRELSKSLAFPKDVSRFKQMTLIKHLSFQVSKDLGIKKTLDIKETLGILEALDHSFEKEAVVKAELESDDMVLSKRFKTSSSGVSNRKVKGVQEETPSVSRHDAGEESVLKGLRKPIQELKEELRKLLSHSGSEERDAQNAKVDAIEDKLSALIRNAWDLFGPVFLEKAEAAVINGKYKPQGVSLGLPLPSGQTTAGAAGDNEANPRNETLSESELRKKVSGSTEELGRARKELANSRVDLAKVVKDPLPALLRNPDATAEAPAVSPGEKRKTPEPSAKRSLLDPHPSAQVQEWGEDEIEESPSRRSPSASRRLHLPTVPSPRMPLTGESSRPTGLGSKPRRQRNKWSDEEVDLLKKEVRIYGKGNWKLILLKHKDVFHSRTEVDMKDKWRNLEKYGLL